MKCEPEYIPRSQRSREAWAKTAATLGLPVDVLQEVYFSRFFAPIQAKDFHALVARGELTRDNIMERTSIAAVKAQIAQREADRKARNEPAIEDEDFDNGDRLNFELKGVLEIGDEWEACETKTYLSGGEYVTKGKRYGITGFTDEGFGEFVVTTKTNLPSPNDCNWVSCHGVRRLFRGGKLIWDWKAAWVRDHNSRHPDSLYPATAEDIALFTALGWPAPSVPTISN